LDIDEDEDTSYNTEGMWTRILSISGEKTPTYVDNPICSDKYKYEANRYVISSKGNWFTFNCDKDNNFISGIASSTAEQLIEVDSVKKVSDKVWNVKLKANIDTLQTKTASISLKSTNIVYDRITDNVTRKMKFVGSINGSLYGSNQWMVEYWRIRFGTQNRQLSPQIAITPEYEAKKGDILIWADGTKETVCSDVKTRVVNGIKENRFKMSGMNVRCRSEKTIKSMWTKSNSFNQSFNSAQASRGTPVFYQRVL
jgi:hypothetical protein